MSNSNPNKNSGMQDMYFRDKQLEMEHEIQLFGQIDGRMASDIHSKLSYLNSAIYYSDIEEQREKIVKGINKKMADIEEIRTWRVGNPKSKKKDKDILKLIHPPLSKEIKADIEKANDLLEVLMPNDTIKMWLKTIGGSITNALSIIDMMDSCHVPVEVIATGHVMSAGIPILMAGTKGFRAATKNCIFMSHNSETGVEGNYEEIMAEAGMIERLDDILKEIAKKRTKIKVKQYKKMDLKTPFYFNAEEALEFGIIDYIIEGSW